MESQAYHYDHKILLFNSQEKNEKEWEYMEMCTSNRVAGVILCSGTVGVEKFTGLNVPLITIERYLENGTAEVECDNEQGGRLAAQHLIDCGCKHLIHISGVHETAMPADARAVGFRAVCEKQGISYKIADTTAFEYNHLEYHQILEKLLKENPDTDGIFASSDLIAAQLLQVCHNLNIDVPSQMKIVGFDDVNINAADHDDPSADQRDGKNGGGTARPFRQWGTCAEPHYSAGITCSKGDDLIQYVYEPGI